jgi:hypothetical protein
VFGSLHSVAPLAREELAEPSNGGFASVNATWRRRSLLSAGTRSVSNDLDCDPSIHLKAIAHIKRMMVERRGSRELRYDARRYEYTAEQPLSAASGTSSC